jgi:hypothetical protein
MEDLIIIIKIKINNNKKDNKINSNNIREKSHFKNQIVVKIIILIT